MSSRDLWIRIGANVTGLTAGIAKAQASVRSFDQDLQKSTKHREAINDLGRGFGLVGVAAAAAGAIAVKKFADFDQAMSAVKATGADAASSIGDLRQAAIDAGAATKFNATESANAIEEMIKAGVDAKDVLGGGLRGALDLAAAGNLDVASAAGIAATALQQFGLSGDKTQHVADILAAAAGKAQGEVSDFAMALNYAGVPANSLGVSIEETTGALAAFAEKGILGEQAGTNLRSILLSLAAPTKYATKMMETYGIQLYDSQGKFIGITKAAGELRDKLGGLSDAKRNKALATIFGKEAIQGALTLYEAGEKGVRKWTKAIDAQGYATEVANTKMDNLKGDWEKFMGSLETAAIGTGEGANGPLRGFVQDLDALVGIYNDLPSGVQSSTLKLIGLTAAIGGGVWAVSKAVTGFSNLANTINDLSGSEQKLTRGQLFRRGGLFAGGLGLTAFSGAIGDANKGLGALSTIGGGALMGFGTAGPIGGAIGAGAGALSLLAGESLRAKQAQQELAEMGQRVADTLNNQTGAITAATEAQIKAELARPHRNKEGKVDDVSVYTKAKTVGANLSDVTKAALGNEKAQDRVNRAAEKYVKIRQQALDQAQSRRAGMDPDTSSLDDLQAADDRLMAADDALGDAQDLTNGLLGSLDSTTNAIGQKRQEIADVNQVAYDAAGAFGDVAYSLAEAAGGANEYVGSIKKVPKDVRTRVAALGAQSSKEDVDVLAKAYKMTPREVASRLLARDLASGKLRYVNGQLINLDGKVAKTTVKADVVEAQAAVSSILNTLDNILPFYNTTVRTTKETVTKKGRAGGGEIGRAGGGEVRGPGTATSDSIPALGPRGDRYRLSDGEHILPADEVQMLGGQRGVYAMREAIRRHGAGVRRASGGEVGASTPSGPLVGRLLDPRVVMDKNGMHRLIDDRFELLQNSHDNYAAANGRAGRGGR